MPRIESIARRSPIRSSSVRCSLARVPASVGPRARLRRRFRRHLAVSPFPREARSGIRRRARGAGRPRGIAAASLAVFGPRLPSEGWDTRSGSGRRGCAGGCAARGCGRPSSCCTLLDGILLSVLPPYDGAPPGLVGGAAARRLREPVPGRGRRAARGRPPAPPPPGPAAPDRRRLRRRGADRRALPRRSSSPASLHRPAVAADRDDDRAMLDAVARLRARPRRPTWAPGLAAPRRARAGARTCTALRARAATRAAGSA